MFIDAHRDAYGVESICEQLPIAPSSCNEHKAREIDPTRVPTCERRDREIKVDIQRVWDESFQLYDARKVRRQLNREQIVVPCCAVERLMRQLGLRGAVRGRAFKTTTESDEQLRLPADLVNRNQPLSAWPGALRTGRRDSPRCQLVGIIELGLLPAGVEMELTAVRAGIRA